MDTLARATGTGVSAGCGRGELQVDADAALDAMDEGRAVVLALETSSPADVPAMVRAAGIVGLRGDAASHTAVVAAAAGVPAVVGLDGARLTGEGLRLGDVVIPVGGPVTVDGTTGVVTGSVA